MRIQPGWWLAAMLFGLVVLLLLLPPAIDCVDRARELVAVLRGNP